MERFFVSGDSDGCQGAGLLGALGALGSLGVRLRFLVVGTLEVVGAQGKIRTPTSWLFGDAPVGRLLGTLTFGQLFVVRCF